MIAEEGCAPEPGTLGVVPAAAVPAATDVLVVGAGPAGSAAAAWAARAGHDVVLADAAVFPRDKTCGDGLTPRAIAELDLLGLGDWVRGAGPQPRAARRRVRPGVAAAVAGRLAPRPRQRRAAHRARRPDPRGRPRPTARSPLDGARAVDVERGRRPGAPPSSSSRRTTSAFRVRLPRGWSSPTACARRWAGCSAGEWHRETAYGVAARGYVRSGRSDDEWISSHLELRGGEGELLSGYGWVFPLGAAAGEVNIGVGTLATARRPAGVQLQGAAGDLHRRPPRRVADRRAGARAGVGAAADGRRRLRRGRAQLGADRRRRRLRQPAQRRGHRLRPGDRPHGRRRCSASADWTQAWPATLRRHYGEAFSIARRLAGLLTLPRFLPAAGPVGHALARADDGGPAGDGQPGDRRRPRRRRPRLAHRRPAVRPRSDEPRSPFSLSGRSPTNGEWYIAK